MYTERLPTLVSGVVLYECYSLCLFATLQPLVLASVEH